DGSTITQNLGNFPYVHTGTGSGDIYEVRQSTATGPAFTDDFNRATLGAAYTTTVAGGDGGASIVSNSLVITNDATAGAGNDGATYVPTATPTSGFNQVLDSNSDIVTWTFNIQQSRPSPSGLTGNEYAAAFILGSTNGIFTGTGAGSGYAISWGQTTTTDPI